MYSYTRFVHERCQASQYPGFSRYCGLISGLTGSGRRSGRRRVHRHPGVDVPHARGQSSRVANRPQASRLTGQRHETHLKERAEKEHQLRYTLCHPALGSKQAWWLIDTVEGTVVVPRSRWSAPGSPAPSTAGIPAGCVTIDGATDSRCIDRHGYRCVSAGGRAGAPASDSARHGRGAGCAVRTARVSRIRRCHDVHLGGEVRIAMSIAVLATRRLLWPRRRTSRRTRSPAPRPDQVLPATCGPPPRPRPS